MSASQRKLELTSSLAKKLVRQHGFSAKIESTTDRRVALEGADYVIVTFRVGGNDAYRMDLEIPAKYGVKQAFADILGPGGVFYALRHIPALLDICHDIEDLCPDALLMNYANPLAMLCWAANDYSRVETVGICDSVQTTATDLAKYIRAPLEEVTYWVAGINHMAWFLEFKWRGKDAYPLLREAFKDRGAYDRPDAHREGPDLARVELFKALGYFNTESSQHISEYLPYFRKRPDLFETFKLGFAIDLSEPVMAAQKRDEAELKRLVEGNAKMELPVLAQENSSHIIHCIETNATRRINANVKNSGLITNLPSGACVEVPILVDGTGLRPCHVGDLPPQCAGLNRTNINVQELAVKAAVERSKTLAFQAILLDPLTSAILTIDEIQKMVDEMFKAEEKYLPDFK